MMLRTGTKTRYAHRGCEGELISSPFRDLLATLWTLREVRLES